MNNVWKSVFYAFFAVVLSGFLGVGCGDDGNKHSWEFGDDDEEETDPKAEKPRYIWIDAAANFPDFANSKENIARDLGLAKESGFTDIVVDVRPTNGDVLFKTTAGSQVEWLGAWVSGVYTKSTVRQPGIIYRPLSTKDIVWACGCMPVSILLSEEM